MKVNKEMDRFRSLRLRLMLEVFKNTVLAVLGSLLAWLLIQTVFRKPILAVIEWFGMSVMGLSRQMMQLWYDRVFRNNEDLIFGLILAVIVIFFLYRAFSRVARYLNEISDAVDKVVLQGTEPILLPAEIAPIADKLTIARSTIAARSAQAVEAERRKNDMVVYLAHDLKTPLTSVIGYVSLLRESVQSLKPEQAEKFAEIALKKAYRLEDLINEMFDIARYNVQEMELVCSSFNLTRMLEQLADEFSPQLSDRNLKISLTLEENLKIYADSDKLARVFDNILKNAAAYAYSGSEIEINAAQEREKVRVRIANRGDCIPPNALSAIFEKFYRVDESRGTQNGSAGLGLAIANEIVIAHGGEITAQSTDEKTEFCVLLPISSENRQNFVRE